MLFRGGEGGGDDELPTTGRANPRKGEALLMGVNREKLISLVRMEQPRGGPLFFSFK